MPQRPDHNTRRAAILNARPEVRRLLGPTTVTAWLGVGVIVLQFGLAALLARQPLWVVAIAAFCVGGFAVHCLNCIVHEASHNLVFESTALNKILAIAANVPSLVPSAMAFRHYHLLHHHQFGVRGMDADIPADWEVRLVQNSSLRKLAWLLLLPVSYGLVHPCHVRTRLPFDIWLTYHPDSNRIPRVRRLIDWIVESFNPGSFPWFRDEFVHPNDLKSVYKGGPLINMFEGFSTDNL